METRTILILGASFAGQSAAHYLLKHVLPRLPNCESYHVQLVDSSSHFWFKLTAPRAMVNSTTVPHSKTFIPIMSGFEQYPKASVSFKQAFVTKVDFQTRKVIVRDTDNGLEESLSFYSLILATGTQTPTPLTTIHGQHTTSINALNAMQQRLEPGTVKEVVIGGAGPTGVETAAEIGEHLNIVRGCLWPSSRLPKARVTLIAAGDRVLEALDRSQSIKAEKYLGSLGVDVLHGTKVKSVVEEEGSKVQVTLDNGKVISADIYIPTVGTKPNTDYMPERFLDSRGYIITNPTLRVEDAGPRVYCVGDVGTHTRGGVISLYSAIPVLGANLARDLGFRDSKWHRDLEYHDNPDLSQVVPIGKSRGVGQYLGWSLPSFVVSWVKGRDFLLSMAPEITHGEKFTRA